MTKKTASECNVCLFENCAIVSVHSVRKNHRYSKWFMKFYVEHTYTAASAFHRLTHGYFVEDSFRASSLLRVCLRLFVPKCFSAMQSTRMQLTFTYWLVNLLLQSDFIDSPAILSIDLKPMQIETNKVCAEGLEHSHESSNRQKRVRL